MKKYILSILAVSLLFCGCSKDETDDPTTTSSEVLTLSDVAFVADPAGDQIVITVTESSDKWYISGSYDWITPSAVSGTSGESVTFTVQENTTDDTWVASYKFFTGSTVQQVEISSIPSPRLSLISEQSDSIDKYSNQVVVELDTNLPLSTISSATTSSWIALKEITSSIGKSVAIFDVEQSDEYTSRESTITLSYGDMTPVKVLVYQDQWDEIIPLNANYTDDYTYPNTSLDAQLWEIEVSANVDYTISSKPDWVVVEQDVVVREDDAVGLTTQTLKFSAEATAEARGGNIVLAGTGASSITIPVGQVDPATETIELEDATLASKIVSLGYAISLGGAKLIPLATENVTSLTLSSSSLTSISGLAEVFPNLESLDVSKNYLRDGDFTGWTTLTSVTTTGNAWETINLGSNKVIYISGAYYYAFKDNGSWSGTGISAPVVFISEYLVEAYYYNSFYTLSSPTLDFSQCPAITKINVGGNYCANGLILSAEYHENNENMSITKDNSCTVTYQ